VLLLTGCVSTTSSSEPTVDDDESAINDSQPQEQVDVPGVQSCRILAQMQSATPEPSDSRIESPRLACLTPGPSVDLDRLRGKPVLVNLWASWCAPCRKEMPVLLDADERFGDRVQFVGVDTQDAASPAAEFLQDFGVNYPQLADPDAELLKQLRIPGLPVTLILGPDGTVLDKHIGAFEGTTLEDLLEEVLAAEQS